MTTLRVVRIWFIQYAGGLSGWVGNEANPSTEIATVLFSKNRGVSYTSTYSYSFAVVLRSYHISHAIIKWSFGDWYLNFIYIQICITRCLSWIRIWDSYEFRLSICTKIINTPEADIAKLQCKFDTWYHILSICVEWNHGDLARRNDNGDVTNHLCWD